MKCYKCKHIMKETGKKKCSSRSKDERGVLVVTYTETTFKCPACGHIDRSESDHYESDGSFYSNSQPYG